MTGGAGVAGRAVAAGLAAAGHRVRQADVTPPPEVVDEFVRCDTRTPTDVLAAVEGCDAVVHLAAWHNAHRPPVSDATVFAVNVDGTFNVVQACRAHGVGSVVFASSMAYGWGDVYAVTKVLGEDLWRMFQEVTGGSVALLRYHAFVPDSYLAWGGRLLRNGVDVRDVADATVAATAAVLEHRVGLFRTIVHTDHGMPEAVRADFAGLGRDWLEAREPGSVALLERYGVALPDEVEQHDLGEAAEVLGWRPRHDFLEFVRDLAARDAAGEDLAAIRAPGLLPTR